MGNQLKSSYFRPVYGFEQTLIKIVLIFYIEIGRLSNEIK